MSLRRQLLVSFGLQGIGAAAVLVATLWLGFSLGPEVQGGFNRAKSEVEFIAAFAMFGLPQALFFHVKSDALGMRAAMTWVYRSSWLALVIGGAWSLLQHPRDGALPWLLAAAVAAMVAHGQLRTLLLVRERTVWFNIVTAAPQLLVLASVGWVVVAGTAPRPAVWFCAFAAAFGLVALAAWRRLQAATDAAGVAADTAASGWRSLGHYGFAAWLTAVLSTGAVIAMQQWVEEGAGRVALGQFTLAMTLVQIPLTPIAYAAPLLLRRWMERPDARAAHRWAAILFLALLCIAGGVWLLSMRWPDLGLGAAYSGATRALALLLVGAAAEAASRLMTVQAGASGLPWVAVRAEAARWAVLASAALAPLPHGLMAWCAVWSLASIAAALVFVWHGRSARAR